MLYGQAVEDVLFKLQKHRMDFHHEADLAKIKVKEMEEFEIEVMAEVESIVSAIAQLGQKFRKKMYNPQTR